MLSKIFIILTNILCLEIILDNFGSKLRQGKPEKQGKFCYT